MAILALSLHKRLRYLCIAFFLISPTGAFAQATAAKTDSPDPLGNTHAAPITSPISPDNAFQLSGTQDSSSATVKIGNSESPREGETLSQSLSLNLPIAKSSNPSALSDISTLPNAYTITAKFGWAQVYGMKNFTPEDLMPYCDKARAEYKKNLMNIGHTEQEADQMAKKEFPINDGCLISQIGKFAKDLYYDALAVTSNKGRPFQVLAGGSGSFGYNLHDYFLPTSTSQQSISKYPWSLGGYVSGELPGQATLLTLSIKYQYAFKDEKTKIICPGKTGIANKDCVSGAIGTPIRQIGDILGFEVRHYFGTLPVLGQIAAAPTFNYDARHGIYGVNLPVYLFQLGGAKGFAGGPQVSWSSDTHVVLAGLFFSKNFSLVDTP